MAFQSIKLFLILLTFSSLDAVSIRRYAFELYENDHCGIDTSVYRGKCKKIQKCVNLLVEKKDIEICSFGEGNRGEDTLVCCSRDDFYKSRMHNKERVLDYDSCMHRYKHLRKTESTSLRQFVVNGVEVEEGEFTFIAAIGWFSWSDFSVSWNCAGNLITENFILSAAHCSRVNGRSPNLVRLGDIDLNSPLDDFYVQQFGIQSIVKHPDYIQEKNENDIALIQIRGKIFPTTNVLPACINSGVLPTEYFEGAGYGQDENGSQSNKLSKVQLKFVDIETCQQDYELKLSSESQICAKGYRDDIDSQDLCYGDSGSGLQYMNTDLVEGEIAYKIPSIVAITSFGIGCAFGFPAVYVNVSNYIDWMESIVNP